jgi:hypothetical protein
MQEAKKGMARENDTHQRHQSRDQLGDTLQPLRANHLVVAQLLPNGVAPKPKEFNVSVVSIKTLG